MKELFAQRFSDLREKSGTTYPELSKETGVSVRALKYYATKEREPSMSVLIALADFFGVSIDYLVGATDDPNQILETVHVIPKKPFLIQDALGKPHKNYPNDFSVEIRGNIMPEALKELEDFINELKNKYVYNIDEKS